MDVETCRVGCAWLDGMGKSLMFLGRFELSTKREFDFAEQIAYIDLLLQESTVCATEILYSKNHN